MTGVLPAGLGILLSLFAGLGLADDGKERITIGGSTTVAPFAEAVKVRLSDALVLDVRHAGTTTGISLLCAADDSDRIEIAAASRPIKSEEVEACAEAGHGTLVEIPIGRDGVVLAQSRRAPPLHLTTLDLYHALAKAVPRGPHDCVLVPNTTQTWRDVRRKLPRRRILLIGPPQTSGTRDAFVDRIMRGGARQYPCLARIEKESPFYFAQAAEIRDDGVWIDGGEFDGAVAVALSRVPRAVGVFGFVHLTAHDDLEAVPVDGTVPNHETIADGTYVLTRTLFLYSLSETLSRNAMAAHVVDAFSGFAAVGPRGFLRERGLVAEGLTPHWYVIDPVEGQRQPIRPYPPVGGERPQSDPGTEQMMPSAPRPTEAGLRGMPRRAPHLN